MEIPAPTESSPQTGLHASRSPTSLTSMMPKSTSLSWSTNRLRSTPPRVPVEVTTRAQERDLQLETNLLRTPVNKVQGKKEDRESQEERPRMELLLMKSSLMMRRNTRKRRMSTREITLMENTPKTGTELLLR